MSKDEYKKLQRTIGFVNAEYYLKGWNAAIDMAAEKARTLVGDTDYLPGDVTVDKESITYLKFKTS